MEFCYKSCDNLRSLPFCEVYVCMSGCLARWYLVQIFCPFQSRQFQDFRQKYLFCFLKIYTQNLFGKCKLQLQLVFDRESFRQFYLGSEGLARETLYSGCLHHTSTSRDKNQTCAVTLANTLKECLNGEVPLLATPCWLCCGLANQYIYIILIAGFLLSYIVLLKFWVICLDILSLYLAALKIMAWTRYQAYSADLSLKCRPIIDCCFTSGRKAENRPTMKILLSSGSSGQPGTWLSSSRQFLGRAVNSGSFSHPSLSCWCFETWGTVVEAGERLVQLAGGVGEQRKGWETAVAYSSVDVAALSSRKHCCCFWLLLGEIL